MAVKKPPSMDAQKRKITLTRARGLCERLLEYHRDGYEMYVRAYREYYGYAPDTDEVSVVWPTEEVVVVE